MNKILVDGYYTFQCTSVEVGKSKVDNSPVYTFTFVTIDNDVIAQTISPRAWQTVMKPIVAKFYPGEVNEGVDLQKCVGQQARLWVTHNTYRDRIFNVIDWSK